MKFIFLLFLLGIQIAFAVGEFDSPATFLNLDSRLNDSQKNKIPAFSRILDNANNNDFEMQILLARKIYSTLENKKIGIELYRDIYNRYGVDTKNSDNILFFSYDYMDLADEYIKATNISAEPILAIKILLNLVKAGAKEAQFKLGYHLADSNYFPNAKYLADVWKDFKPATKKIHIDKVIADYKFELESYTDEKVIPEPNKELFKTCNNQFDKNTQVLELFQQLQYEMLTDGMVSDEELKQAYDQFDQSVPINMQFRTISAKALLSLLLDLMGMESEQQYKLIVDENFNDINFDLILNEVPHKLFYQKLIEKLNVDVSCYQNWLLFTSIGDNIEPSKKMLLSNFITYREELDDNRMSINWDSDISYTGGFLGGKFDGEGTIVFKDRENKPYRIVEGNFQQGLLNGIGKDYDVDGNYFYQGQYRNGLYDGKGYLQNKYEQINQKGRFVDGEYVYSEKQAIYFPRDNNKEDFFVRPEDFDSFLEDKKNLINHIKYIGPVTDMGKAHGKGHCYLQKLDYDCSFYQGYLIGVESFSIVPDYVEIK